MPRSSTSVLGLDYKKKDQQELWPRGPSFMLPLSSHIKDAFDKFEHDFLASNLPEGKYIKPPPSTAKWYKVGQPCYEDKIQELNTDLSKICISPKPSGAPMGKVTLPVLKELEHQARQNLSTINFMAAFAKTSSSCNSTSLAHILQRELYTICNTGLLRLKAAMTLLQPHLGETRCQELGNSPFWPSFLFKSQLVKEGEDFLLKKAPLKMLRVSHPT